MYVSIFSGNTLALNAGCDMISTAGLTCTVVAYPRQDELGSGLKFLLGSLQLVLEVSPRWPVIFFRVCGLDSFAECVWALDASSTWALICVR